MAVRAVGIEIESTQGFHLPADGTAFHHGWVRGWVRGWVTFFFARSAHFFCVDIGASWGFYVDIGAPRGFLDVNGRQLAVNRRQCFPGGLWCAMPVNGLATAQL